METEKSSSIDTLLLLVKLRSIDDILYNQGNTKKLLKLFMDSLNNLLYNKTLEATFLESNFLNKIISLIEENPWENLREKIGDYLNSTFSKILGFEIPKSEILENIFGNFPFYSFQKAIINKKKGIQFILRRISEFLNEVSKDYGLEYEINLEDILNISRMLELEKEHFQENVLGNFLSLLSHSQISKERLLHIVESFVGYDRIFKKIRSYIRIDLKNAAKKLYKTMEELLESSPLEFILLPKGDIWNLVEEEYISFILDNLPNLPDTIKKFAYLLYKISPADFKNSILPVYDTDMRETIRRAFDLIRNKINEKSEEFWRKLLLENGNLKKLLEEEYRGILHMLKGYFGLSLDSSVDIIKELIINGNISAKDLVRWKFAENGDRYLLEKLFPYLRNKVIERLKELGYNPDEIYIGFDVFWPLILEIKRKRRRRYYLEDLVKFLEIYNKGYWNDPEIQKVLNEMEKIGINVRILKGTIVDVLDLKGGIRAMKELPPEERYRLRKALGTIVLYAISRNRERFEFEFQEAKEVLKKYLKNFDIDKVIEELLKLRGAIKKRVIKYVKENLNGSFDKLRKILLSPYGYSLAKEFLRNLKKEPINDLINNLEGIIGKELKGNIILAYIGKGPWMLMDSRLLKMCAYYPYEDGANYGAAIYYQLDPRVLEIRLVNLDKVPKNVDWKLIEKIKNPGEYCLLSYIALDKNGKKVLILDEPNGVLDFPKENKWYIKYLLRKISRELNIDYIVLCRGEWGGEKTEIKLKIIGDSRIPHTKRREHYFSFGYGDDLRVPNNVKGTIIDVDFSSTLEDLVFKDKDLEIWVTNSDWKNIDSDIMYIEYLAFNGEEIMQDEKELGKYWRDINSVRFVVKKGNEIVGYRLIVPPRYLEEMEPGYRGYYIMSTAVLPKYQGKGVGKKLIRESFKYLKKIGIKEVYAHITHPAIERIYNKLKEEGVIKKIEVIKEYKNKSWNGRDAKFVRVRL